MPMGAAYLVNIMVLRKFDLAAVGCYSGGLGAGRDYVGFIFAGDGSGFLSAPDRGGR